jgi:diamine N-acetyltransferase
VADRRGGEIHRAYVDAPFQGRGIGSRLVAAALARPKLAGEHCVYLQVWEENRDAIRFSERFGFRIIGRTTFKIGDGTVLEDLVMERKPQ